MKDLNLERTQKLLSRIMEFELAGVVRYTHYSLMVTGPNRIPIVAFMQAQASESLLHAQQAGELLTGLGGTCGLAVGSGMLLLFLRSLGYYFESVDVLFAWPSTARVASAALGVVLLAAVVGVLGAVIPAYRISRQEPYLLVQREGL